MPHIMPEERAQATQTGRIKSRLDSIPPATLSAKLFPRRTTTTTITVQGGMWRVEGHPVKPANTDHLHNERVSKTTRPVAFAPFSTSLPARQLNSSEMRVGAFAVAVAIAAERAREATAESPRDWLAGSVIIARSIRDKLGMGHREGCRDWPVGV